MKDCPKCKGTGKIDPKDERIAELEAEVSRLNLEVMRLRQQEIDRIPKWPAFPVQPSAPGLPGRYTLADQHSSAADLDRWQGGTTCIDMERAGGITTLTA